MDICRWVQFLVEAFPDLGEGDFEIVDEPSMRYNCIAYAAGENEEWWWPDGANYWPPWATRDSRMESLKEVFAGLGYEPCDDGTAVEGYRKVALYEDNGIAQHAALQVPNGRWRSKMGQGPVIEHRNPESLSGGVYGVPTTFMRKAVPADF